MRSTAATTAAVTTNSHRGGSFAGPSGNGRCIDPRRHVWAAQNCCCMNIADDAKDEDGGVDDLDEYEEVLLLLLLLARLRLRLRLRLLRLLDDDVDGVVGKQASLRSSQVWARACISRRSQWGGACHAATRHDSRSTSTIVA